MCGSEGEVFRTSIEDVILNVCSQCSKFGKVMSSVKVQEPKEIKKQQIKMARQPEKETIFIIVQDYSEKIKKAREKLGLKQVDFAKKINEKDSVISKLETGGIEPSIKLARKLEKFLNIKLVDEYQESSKALPKTKGKGFTIGDMVKVRKK